MPVKTWSRVSGTLTGYGSYTNNPSVDYFTDSGTNITISHHRYDEYPTYRTGGPWQLSKVENILYPADVVLKNGSGTSTLYAGSIAPKHFGDIPPNPIVVSDANMDQIGATAMSRVLPTNPNAELLNALTELYRDGIPSMPGVPSWENRTNAARAAGSDYLNYEFGWLPLVSDIQKVAKSTRDSSAILDRFINDSDKVIHRRYDYPATTTTQVYSGSGYGNPSDSRLQWSGQTVVRRTTERWFEGAFMYHVPAGDDIVSKLQRFAAKADKLYGVSLTPEVVYNATPWTWAIDWFSNTGDVITNISQLGKDGLALLYGYMMCSETVSRRTDASGQLPNGTKYAGGFETIRTVKQRRPANPYGFGLSGLALSLRQQAVVAAIAATRGGGRHGR